MTVQYPLEYSTLVEDAKRLVEYIKFMNDPSNDSAARKEAAIRACFRVTKIDTELTAVGKFVNTAIKAEEVVK